MKNIKKVLIKIDKIFNEKIKKVLIKIDKIFNEKNNFI